ncbi:MAG: hypothetical protein GWP10_22480 [Nitrospiraceae bacterium]|nr:hypothetical protein [Nitrospiraceae bacterium]
MSEDIELFTGTENIKIAVLKLVGILEDLGHRIEVKSVSITFGRLFISLKNRSEMLKIDLVADRLKSSLKL